MVWLLKKESGKDKANPYATSEDFCKVFTDDMDSLYVLSLLLTGNHEEAEQCFIASLEECIQAHHVFRDWARSWARRTVVQNAIRTLLPNPDNADSSSPGTFPPFGVELPTFDGEHFEFGSVLELWDFERFVFVMAVLEQYSDHKCALLLGCSLGQVRKARAQAISRLMDQVAPILPMKVA